MAIPWVTITHVDDASAIQVHPGALDDLPLDRTSTPQLITLIGKHEKAHMLRHLVGDDAGYPLVPHGQLHVWADPRTSLAPHPRVFLDCELYTHNASQITSPTSYLAPEYSKQLAWLDFGNQAEACAALCANVLCPVSSLIYLFAADVGGLNSCARMIARQVTKYVGIQTLRPHLIVVIEEPIENEVFTAMLRKAIEHARKEHANEGVCRVDKVFSKIEVLHLGRTNRSGRSDTLLEHMISSGALHQKQRDADGLSFKFSHTIAFASHLIHKLSEAPTLPFSFIVTSRPAGHDHVDFASHLTELLRTIESEAWIWHFIVPLVSACILLANYPPGSHCKSVFWTISGLC